MKNPARLRATVLRPVILALTGLAVWGVLWVGHDSGTLAVGVGDSAPETFVTDRSLEIPDVAGTEAARERAVAGVDDVFRPDDTVEAVVTSDIQGVFDAAVAGTAVAGPSLRDQVAEIESTTTTIADPEPTTTTTDAPAEPDPDVGAEGESSDEPAATTTTIPSTADVTGQLYIDVNLDDVFSDVADAPIPGVLVEVTDSLGVTKTATTASTGLFVVRDLAPGPAEWRVDAATVPETLTTEIDRLSAEIELVLSDTVEVDALGFDPVIRDRAAQIDDLAARYGSLESASVELLVDFASGDVVRAASGNSTWLEFIETEAIDRAAQELDAVGGIRSADLNDVKEELRSSIPLMFLPSDDFDSSRRASIAAGQIAAEFLQANSVFDPVETEAARQAAAAAVEGQVVSYQAGDVIADAGEELTEIQILALRDAGFFRPAQIELVALAAIVTLIIAVIAVYVARFRPRLWSQMRRLSSFGVLIVLAAASARGVSLFIEDAPEVGFLMPAAAIGLMAAILFDARIAVLMAVVTGAVTAVASGNAGLTMFATIATITPVPWVSSISARNDLRKAVMFSTLGLALVSAVSAWFFLGESFVVIAAGYGAINGVMSGLVGTAALSFFEIAFDLTTNLRLLDITDRNHAALRLLEEKATGTFNHSLMVGTLADRAARAIGANALLARAAAYYHDLGKTENPQFFIENQFGISNPHDAMPPDESAAVIRQHVIDGQVLAKRFDLPSEVIEGVITHHGDGIMRFFYHKALERYGEEHVDIDDYRHAGRKPQTREMAIVMMADSVEGACRAIFEKEDPSPHKITEVVERVVGEKVSDGQLSESDLTLNDLTTAKAAMAEALRGHYHQRIPYPNFPQLGDDDGPSGGPAGPDAGGDDGSEGDDDEPSPDPSRNGDTSSAVKRSSTE